MKRRTILTATGAAALMASTGAQAQAWPSRPITLYVPFAAGGPSDMFGRILARGLSAELGQQVVVENKGGMGGLVGVAAIAKAAPDGYTIGMNATGPSAIAPFMVPNMPFEDKDLVLLTPIALVQMIVAVSSRLPVGSVAELIAYAKANPGKVNFGSQGVGTTPHLTGELFARVTGIKLTHVPYRGTAQAVNDLIAGHLDLLFFQLDSVREQVQAKRAKMLAVTTPERVPAVPEVPTMDEAGVKGFRSDTWNALAAPPKTPAAIVAKLNAGINEVLKQPDTAEHLRGMNMTPIGGAPDGIKAFIKDETERWGDVIRAAKITAD
jgi:tripartite-type tricarboxylate transporter receptor subunit TctC